MYKIFLAHTTKRRARLMAERELLEHLSGYRQFAVRNKKYGRNYLPKRAHAERTSAHTSCEISTEYRTTGPSWIIGSPRERRETGEREATVPRIISDLKSLLHHFLPPVPLELILSSPFFRSVVVFFFFFFFSLLLLSWVLGVRLCFWLGSGVIGSPKPVLIIDPPAWQLPAKPLSTSCVPGQAQFPTLRDLPRSCFSTEVRGAGRRLARRRFSLFDKIT